jgi:Bacterial Ig domain
MMKHQSIFKLRPVAAAGAALITLLAAPAQAVTYTVIAEPTVTTMPDGFTAVPMWGYRVSDAGGDEANAASKPLTSPGAALVVPPTDSTLSVNLFNRLPGVPTSLVVHGLYAAMTPVFVDGAGLACTPGVGATDPIRRACRVRSFTKEAPTGNPAAVNYTYDNVRPGTYLYQSGTQPQIQVQMGLYGMMSKDAAVAGAVYPGVSYASQSRVIFSEVDAALHAAVAAGTFTGSTLDYDPKHMRAHVYGANNLPVQADAGAVPSVIGTAAPHLVRMANAGLQTRVPTLSNGTWALLGEDAQPYPYSREQYTAFLPAAKTTEAWIGASRSFAVFDRRMAFADSFGGVAGQFLQFSTTPVAVTQLAANCPTEGTQGVTWTCTVTSTTPGATLSLSSGPAGMTTLLTVAGLQLNWTPSNAQAQRPADATLLNRVVVAASSSAGTVTRGVNVAVANVNDAPTALPSSHTGAAGVRSFSIAAANGALANDSDIDGDALSASVVTPPVDGALTLNADGSFSYTLAAATMVPAAGLTRSFTYRATDTPSLLTPAPALSADSTVTMSFVSGLAANADSFTFTNTNLRPLQTFNVTANDTSTTTPAFQANSIRVSRTDPGAGIGLDGLAPATTTLGAVQTPNNGTNTITYLPPLNGAVATGAGNAPVAFTGTDSFWYRINSNAGTPTNWTRVDVAINVPAAPVTVADSYTFDNNGIRPIQTIAVLANDTSSNGFNNLTIEVAREANGVGATFGQLAATTTRGLVDTPVNNGTITYRSRTANLGGAAAGTDYFYYRIMNASGVRSAWTRVDVIMN